MKMCINADAVRPSFRRWRLLSSTSCNRAANVWKHGRPAARIAVKRYSVVLSCLGFKGGTKILICPI